MDVQEILNKCTVDGLTIKLPPGTLEFKTFSALKKFLEQRGGKWNGGKVQGFSFEVDPSPLVNKVDELPAQTSLALPADEITEEKSDIEVEENDQPVFDAMQERKCRICGCTDNDCSKCIKLTGHPCHWVEPDLCSACADALFSDSFKQKNQSPKNDDEMNFFRQLAGMGNVDVTLRIMQKNGKLTMMVLPGSASSATMPLNFTGTPEELDAEFFTTIAPAANEVAGIVSNVDEVKEVAKKEPEKKVTTPAKKTAAPAKKPAPAKQKPKSVGKTATKHPGEKPAVKNPMDKIVDASEPVAPVTEPEIANEEA